MRNNFKSSKGITLIALVITIIVLLILAGVTIATLMGDNGILTRANNASVAQIEGQVNEEVKLAVQSAKMFSEEMATKSETGWLASGNLGSVKEVMEFDLTEGKGYKVEDGTGTITVTYETDRYKQATNNTDAKIIIVITVTGNTFVIGEAPTTPPVTPSEPSDPDLDPDLDPDQDPVELPEGWEASKLNTTTPIVEQEVEEADGETKTYQAPIPKGFTVSTEPGETQITTGLVVINDDDQSEFVWVPVEEVSTMARMISDETNKDANGRIRYRGILYNFGTESSPKNPPSERSYNPTSGYREPANLSTKGVTIDSVSYEYDSTQAFSKYNAGTFTETMYEEEYDAMVESVAKYGGFYVGRYETSKSGNTIASTKGTTSTRPMANVTWYELYSKQKAYKSDEVQSTMIWGSQWDAMLNWALEGEDAAKVRASNKAPHNLSATYQPGTQTNDEINNIYDLEGNVTEWILEANNSNYRVLRGGYYDSAYSPSVRYGGDPPTISGPYYGSRVSLYIK